MSEFRVPVIRVGPLEKHPNADRLLITRVWDYPVVIRAGDLQEGGLAAYIPVDSVVKEAPQFAFLGEPKDYGTEDRQIVRGYRIKARKIRGTFSMGLLVSAPEGLEERADAREALGVFKYAPPEDVSLSGQEESPPGGVPTYTDIEGLRRWPELLLPGEEVVIHEKIHGANARFTFAANRPFVGSHRCWWKENPSNAWWKAALQMNLLDILRSYPNKVLMGEVFGWIADLRYGHSKGQVSVLFFDVFDMTRGCYLDFEELRSFLASVGLSTPPLLYRGPWRPELAELAEGPSLIPHSDHPREGIVVRPMKERWNDSVGRVILKLHGKGYLLRKE